MEYFTLVAETEFKLLLTGDAAVTVGVAEDLLVLSDAEEVDGVGVGVGDGLGVVVPEPEVSTTCLVTVAVTVDEWPTLSCAVN